MTSERRRLRAGGDRPTDDGTVPRALRRFRREDWPEAGDTFTRHKRWREARRAWATAHGFDLHAPYGTHPDRDWQAFLALCERENPDDPDDA